jgi:hypothetical protein
MIGTFRRRVSRVVNLFDRDGARRRRAQQHGAPQQHCSPRSESSQSLAPPRSVLTRPTPFDIAAVLHLLSSRTSPLAGRVPLLPLETTLAILDLAEYWQPLHGVLPAPACIVDDVGEALHVLAPAFPLHSTPARMIRRIEIRTISHDQGWSSYRDTQGAHLGSWTWFEVALLDNDMSPASPRFKIIRNAHANSEWKEHFAMLGPEHPLSREARPGQRIALFACAQYPLWVNHVRELEVTVYLSWP